MSGPEVSEDTLGFLEYTHGIGWNTARKRAIVHDYELLIDVDVALFDGLVRDELLNMSHDGLVAEIAALAEDVTSHAQLLAAEDLRDSYLESRVVAALAVSRGVSRDRVGRVLAAAGRGRGRVSGPADG